jgi:hypothetical protein
VGPRRLAVPPVTGPPTTARRPPAGGPVGPTPTPWRPS